MEQTDTQLVAEYRKGNEEILVTIIQRYINPVYTFVYHLVLNEDEASDITQEVFIKLWKHLKNIIQSKTARMRNATIIIFVLKEIA